MLIRSFALGVLVMLSGTGTAMAQAQFTPETDEPVWRTRIEGFAAAASHVTAADPAWSYTVAVVRRQSRGDSATLPRASHAIGHGSLGSLGSLAHLGGLASFYGDGVGQHTANGERFDKRALTAAHKSLPFGSKVKVTSLTTGRTVTVRINDRGPFKPGRIIDLSEGAADELGMRSVGLVPVKLDLVHD